MKLNGEKVTITKEAVQENTKSISSMSTYSRSTSWRYIGSSKYTVTLSNVIRDMTIMGLATLMETNIIY